jgi:phospholipid/cholesterol/gamma-HCH transport system substrate-binding protein
MNLHLPRSAVAGVLAFAVVSLALLGFMLVRLGTVPLPGAHPLHVRALIATAEGLPAAADVLVHGVRVGEVSGIAARRGGTLVTLSLGSNRPSLHPDASVRVGFKTALGESFVELDPGRAGGSVAPGALVRSRPTIAIDDALAFLNRSGRADARAAIVDLGRGAAAPDTAARVNRTLAALQATTAEVGRLAAALRAQRADLAGTISDGRVVLDTLANRAAQLRALSTDARATLGAVAGQRSALAATVDRLPGLLTSADATLRSARPLLAKATPVVNELGVAAPALTQALAALPAVTASAAALLRDAPAIRSTVIPALGLLGKLAGPANTALRLLGPTLADLVPVAQYLAPRGNTIAAWFANTADLGSHGDAKGDWARFFVMFDPATLFGLKTGAPPGNTYTAPGDAAHNAPYQSGGFPRLEPYAPALAAP